MKKIVLLRHGQSTWNLENRFTGWTDVDLTPQGKEEARQSGKLMTDAGLIFDKVFTSYLKRAIKTLNIALDEMNLDYLPVEKSWRLNEKHYGNLQGLNKAETSEKYGAEQVLLWRRSYDVAPAPIPADDKRSPRFDLRYKDLTDAQLPLTESLKTCIERTLPYWQNVIWPELKNAQNLLVVAHGNSLRGIIKYLKNISDEDIVSLNLPTGVPYVFEFDDNYNLAKDYFLGDAEEIKKQMEKVAKQAERK